MNKQQFQSALEKTSVKPVYRTNILGNEVFVADGFIEPERFGILDRFGVTATALEYPNGCYATIWYSPKKSGPGGCELHPKNNETSRYLRIRSIVLRATTDLVKNKKLN